MKIGIGVSTHNRREIADHSIAEWRRFLPDGAKLVIVDDASDIPYPTSDYRFETQAGIAVVKNKCLELLEGCEYIFLSDDDFYPLNDNWWWEYIKSDLQHACYVFDRPYIYKDTFISSYELPRGVLLYFTKKCIQAAGGFDTKFELYGYDHAELSRRIFNMGLTPAPYIDVSNSKGLFYSHDEQSTVMSSLRAPERIIALRQNKKYFEQTVNSNQFVPYK